MGDYGNFKTIFISMRQIVLNKDTGKYSNFLNLIYLDFIYVLDT